MEIRYKLFPYPVLAYYSDDYSDTTFDATINLCRYGYNIRIDFISALTNTGLKKLIEQDMAKYVYHLECAQTGYRHVVITDKELESYILSNKEVCGKLQICPFIVATNDIEGYTNTAFHDDYAGMSFDIEAGCILAIGKQVNADIEKEIEDLGNTPSVFSIVCNADASVTEMLVDISNNQKIIIKMPLNDYYNYKQLSKAPEAQSILNAITVIPALAYTLSEISKLSIDEREQYQEYGWYRTIQKTLHAKFSCDIESDDFDQENPLILAQRLINNPATDALKTLCTGFSNSGGDDE